MHKACLISLLRNAAIFHKCLQDYTRAWREQCNYAGVAICSDSKYGQNHRSHCTLVAQNGDVAYSGCVCGSDYHIVNSLVCKTKRTITWIRLSQWDQTSQFWTAAVSSLLALISREFTTCLGTPPGFIYTR